MMQPLIVILAGGEGSRIGGAKPLKILGGETLIARALRFATALSDDVRVAVREGAQSGVLSVPTLLDRTDVWGPLAGLFSALKTAQESGCSHVLTIPCDMPFLPPDLRKRLQAAIGSNGAALASSDGQLHPVCGLWSTATLDKIEPYLASGRRSLKGLAEAVGFVAVDWPEVLFANINTPAELAAAERSLASEVQDLNR